VSGGDLTFLVLPGGDPAGLAGTVEAVRTEAAPGTPVLGLPGPGLEAEDLRAAGIEPAEPEAIAESDGFVAFVRAGDRLIPGALEARLRTFTAYPKIGLAIAGHVLTTPDGSEIRRVPAPAPGLDPDLILIGRTVEAAGVLARAGALEGDHARLLAEPFGDIVVFARVARETGYCCSGEFAAEVRLDPGRHGHAGPTWSGPLIEAVRATAGEEREGDSATRRELLRRLYLSPEGDAEPVALPELFAGKLASPETAAAVVADLQWIAERQSEALRLERLRWADGDVDPEDLPPLTISEEILEAQAKLGEAGARLGQLDNAVRRLEAEVYRRDAIISELKGLTHAEAHELGATAGEDES